MIILASASGSRRAMLDAAGIEHEALAANIDEAAIKDRMRAKGADAGAIADELAKAKALAVSALCPDQLVLGGDSIVSVGDRLFDKPASRNDAGRHLRAFSGQLMRLSSAAAFARNGEIVDSTIDEAELSVRPLSDAFIEAYLDHEWPAIAGCVGCFRIEARGVQLFERTSGSHFTILGMPLLWVLAALRRQGVLAE